MVEQMEKEGFGACTNTEACSAECPKEISMDVIAQFRREYYRAMVKAKDQQASFVLRYEYWVFRY